MSGFGVTKEQLCELMTADAETQKAMLKQFGGVAGVTEALKVNPEVGLSDSDVRSGSRASAFGANTLPDPPSKSFLELLWEGTEDGTIRILTVAALISLFLGIFFPPEGEESVAWIEGAAILVAVVLVIFVGAANNYSKEQQFKELDKQKETKPVELIRNGSETEISSDDLVVGDIVLLKQGERIPGDCLYIDGRGTSECKIDTSVMTGETVAVTVNSGSPIMLSGTILDEGLARAVVIAVGESSQYGILFKNLQADNPETPLEQKLETLADWIGYGGLGAAIVLFGVLLAFFLIEQYTGVHTLPHCIVLDQPFSKVCWFMEQDPDWGPHAVQRITEIFIMAITIVVVAVPEGLPLAVTLSLAYSMKQMMQDNCLVRRLASCETMGGATTICSDKTGTLTENRMTVTKGTVGDQVFESVPPSFPISKQMLQLLCDGIAINSKANVAAPKTKEIGALPVFTGNKTECALLVYAAALQPGYAYHAVRKDAEQHTVRLFNFNSDRKRMSTVVRLPSEEVPFRMYTKGASEVIVERCSRVMTSDGTVRELSEKDVTLFNEFINTMADEGLRTIGIGFRDFADVEEITPIEGDADWEPPENDLILLSIVGIMDPIRKEVPGAVRTCQEAGILVRVVTGDNPKTATKIAHDCGILREGGVVLTGPEFRKMSDQELDRVLPRLQVLARSIPSDKKRLVERLMANGEVVAATGDGTNDGPALKAAHVGLAMGLSGTDVAKQASDIVILDDNFKSIVLAVMWGRCVYDNIKKFLQFQLTVNVAAVSVALLAALTDRGTPLAAIQLLWVNLIMDTFAALALGTEKPTPDLLTRKPYGLDEKVPISRVMWRNIIGQSIYQIAVLLVLIYLGAELLGLPDMSAYHYTLVFNTFVWMQLFNEINSRKVNNEWNIFENFFGNWMFAAILVLTAGVQIIIIELGGEVMKTAHQDWREWGLAIGLGVLSIPLGFIIRLIPVGDPSQMAPEAVEERKPLLTGKEKMRSFGGEKESRLDLEAPGDEHGWGDKGKKVY